MGLAEITEKDFELLKKSLIEGGCTEVTGDVNAVVPVNSKTSQIAYMLISSGQESFGLYGPERGNLGINSGDNLDFSFGDDLVAIAQRDADGNYHAYALAINREDEWKYFNLNA